MEDHFRVTRTAAPSHDTHRKGLLLIGVAIVLTGLNPRTAVNSIGPVLEEIEHGLGLSSGMAGVLTSLPVLCFAALGFAGPALSARFRDAHVLAGALLSMTAGLVLRAVAGSFLLFVVGTVLAMAGGALGNVLLPSLVKRYFPDRTGLLVGAYSTALSVGGTAASVATQPIAASVGADGWRWALGIWAVVSLVGVLAWLVVPAGGGGPRGGARGGRGAARHARRRPDAVAGAQPDRRGPDRVLRDPGDPGLRHRRLVGAVPARRRAQRGHRRTAAGPQHPRRHPVQHAGADADRAPPRPVADAAGLHGLLRRRVDRALGRTAGPALAVDGPARHRPGHVPHGAHADPAAGADGGDDGGAGDGGPGLGLRARRRRPVPGRRPARRHRRLHRDVRPGARRGRGPDRPRPGRDAAALRRRRGGPVRPRLVNRSEC